MASSKSPPIAEVSFSPTVQQGVPVLEVRLAGTQKSKHLWGSPMCLPCLILQRGILLFSSLLLQRWVCNEDPGSTLTTLHPQQPPMHQFYPAIWRLNMQVTNVEIAQVRVPGVALLEATAFLSDKFHFPWDFRLIVK